MYTIGQVSELFELPISTLRYYDKRGFFLGWSAPPGFAGSEKKEIETLRLIECLKRSSLEIKDIKQFIDRCQQGTATYEQRRAENPEGGFQQAVKSLSHHPTGQ